LPLLDLLGYEKQTPDDQQEKDNRYSA